MTTMLTIGGLPAERFIGRFIRFRSPKVVERSQNLMPGKLLDVNRNKLLIQPFGHKRAEWLEPLLVTPWWSRNTDLRCQEGAEDSAEEIDEIEPEPEPVEEIKPVEEEKPETVETPASFNVKPMRIKHPTMIVGGDVATDWPESYRVYLQALVELSGAEELLEVARSMVEQSRKELEGKGVRFEGAEQQKPQETSSEPRKRKITPRNRDAALLQLLDSLNLSSAGEQAVCRVSDLNAQFGVKTTSTLVDYFRSLNRRDYEFNPHHRAPLSGGRPNWYVGIRRK